MPNRYDSDIFFYGSICNKLHYTKKTAKVFFFKSDLFALKVLFKKTQKITKIVF